MRKILRINDSWIFEKEGVKTPVSLPHTWNASDGQTGPQMYYRGRCLYTKTFEKPELSENEQVYLEFRGVNSSAEVFINGTSLKKHDGGYSTFRVNITNELTEENTLEVAVDNSANDRVYPQRADFTFYGGIYRDVYMIICDAVHFDLDYYGGSGFQITPKVNGNDAEIDFTVYASSGAEKAEVCVNDQYSTVINLEEKDGKAVGTGSILIENAHRWNGLEDPYLYTAQAVLYAGGKETDRIVERFGVREYSVDPEKGFILNGKVYPLRGVSRHQDRLGVGNALTPAMHEEDMELILSAGANSIRLAHYQHDQYFYDLCDEKGVLCWAEIPYITVHMDHGRENTICQMKELITQNYNHPSIYCWALGNEITLNGVTEDLMENHRILNDLVHTMDPSRLSAMANLFLLETDSPLVTLPDIRGYNLYFGWYVGSMQDNDK